MESRRLLALNPFHAGSHRAFIEGWQKASRHEFTLLTLPGTHWKWRMRHAAASFAFEVNELLDQSWDAVFTTDMLNLAEFRGLVNANVAQLPTVLYFHENQFAYPARGSELETERDRHFAMTNLVSIMSADAVWFNSKFNLSSLRTGIAEALDRLPHLGSSDGIRWCARLDQIFDRAEIHSPGIDPIQPGRDTDGPLHLLWAARWEHDKNPGPFFESLRELRKRNIEFRLSVVGESFSRSPACFDEAKSEFSDQIVNWGYAPTQTVYRDILANSDVVVSTALHEFFGVAVVEAMSAGCVSVLPERLAYPEVVDNDARFLYAGQTGELTSRLAQLADMKRSDRQNFMSLASAARELALRFSWEHQARRMDDAIEELISDSVANHDF